MSNIDLVKDYSYSWYRCGGLLKLRDLTHLVVIGWLAVYFFGSLNMAEKICAFAISGKVVGTDYILKLRDIYIISGAVISTMLAVSTYNFFKSEKNRSRIKLRITEASPLSLTVRLA